jgi:hypothetical protein
MFHCKKKGCYLAILKKLYEQRGTRYTATNMRYFLNYLAVISIVVILIAVPFNNCSRLEPNSPPCHEYLLLLTIHDVHGRDILQDMPIQDSFSPGATIIPDKYGWDGVVKPELYKLDIVLPELCFVSKKPATQKTDKKLIMSKLHNNFYLGFCEKSTPSCPPVETITFKLTCPFIFGDSSEHIIISNWNSSGKFRTSDNFPRNECYSITVDGKEWHVEQEIFTPNKREEFIDEMAQNERKDYSRIISVARIIMD